jgi:hypothetical protein
MTEVTPSKLTQSACAQATELYRAAALCSDLNALLWRVMFSFEPSLMQSAISSESQYLVQSSYTSRL